MKWTAPRKILPAPAAIRLDEDTLSVLEDYRIAKKAWLDASDDAPDMKELEHAFHYAAAEFASWVDAEIDFQLELAGRTLPVPSDSPGPGCIHCMAHEQDV
ncbi:MULTISPECIES: hypothetical protein [unclassified Pseudomonas]|uniref:hypothetical protein n=1 Tax=unclassified Pseudomonas TaxID=196821 RepID=UPI0030D961CF